MGDADFPDIESVTVEVDHCHRCGSAVQASELGGRELGWCPDCEHYLNQVPVPAVHVVVHGDGKVLVLDEAIPQHDGLWSLPGGFTDHDEGPKEAGIRELAEETGLWADPADLELVTVQHAETARIAFYLVSYAVERSDVSGEITPEADGFEVQFRQIEEVLAAEDRMRETDRERIRLAVEE